MKASPMRSIVLALTLSALLPVGSLALAQQPAATTDPVKGATPLGTEILLFERAVKWEVVSPKWVERRPGWMSATAKATDPGQLALAIAQLETNMGWSSVQPEWRQRRDGWLADVKAATTMGSAARILLELEGMTKWEAVQPKWKELRSGWVERVKAVAGK